ncbi:hypothetical protein KFE98_00170 [bacterium SCSIO 12741]|nr:hypothetical protein KFE98_00170 [bacterium SCSIO 12741]
MKAIITLCAIVLFSVGVHAQNAMKIWNQTSCTYIVQMYAVPAGNCTASPFVVNYNVSGGASVGAIAPAGYEWIYAEITSFPYCTGGALGIAPGADIMSGCIGCTWGAPSSVSGPTFGCNGCQPFVTAEWHTCNQFLHIF